MMMGSAGAPNVTGRSISPRRNDSDPRHGGPHYGARRYLQLRADYGLTYESGWHYGGLIGKTPTRGGTLGGSATNIADMIAGSNIVSAGLEP